jgi:hypothetical protein
MTSVQPGADQTEQTDFSEEISVAIQTVHRTMQLRSSDRIPVQQENIMLFRKRGFRATVLGLLVAAGLALTPAAFARSNVSVGIAVPGVSIGYGPGYYGYYGRAYYGPAYYPAYYDPYYYGGYYGPSVSFYYDGYGHRHYYHGGHYRGGHHGGYSHTSGHYYHH